MHGQQRTQTLARASPESVSAPVVMHNGRCLKCDTTCGNHSTKRDHNAVQASHRSLGGGEDDLQQFNNNKYIDEAAFCVLVDVTHIDEARQKNGPAVECVLHQQGRTRGAPLAVDYQFNSG